jgi:hypothetical protein
VLVDEERTEQGEEEGREGTQLKKTEPSPKSTGTLRKKQATEEIYFAFFLHCLFFFRER